MGWLLAYLGGPDIVRGWIEAVAGDNRIIIMYLMVIVLTIAGDFLDGVPAIAIFMPIIVALIKLAHINPVHMTKYDWAGRGADQLSPQTYREWGD